MAKVISATEAKVRWGKVMDWVADEGEEVIIETRGRPRAVLVSYEAYQEFRRLREKARREEALQKLEALAAEVRKRNRDLSAEEAEALADRFVREVIEEMATEGKIAFREG